MPNGLQNSNYQKIKVMKNKFKKFFREHIVIFALGALPFILAGWLLIPSWISHNGEEDTPMESTTDNSISAESFEYKGHQYILFSTGSRLGPSGFLHDPDCKKCK